MKTRARAALRLGLAGGGTDLTEYSDLFGGVVVNATLDKYAYATISDSERETTNFSSGDQQASATITDLRGSVLDSNLQLHAAVYRRMMLEFNGQAFMPLNVRTYTDAPIGSGLGTSSTITVALVTAFAAHLGLSLNQSEIARIAFQVERIDCGLAGGKQDHYSAAFGGLNVMEFSKENVKVNPLKIQNEFLLELESSLLLFYTGQSRASAQIISDQTASLGVSKNVELEAMHVIKEQAVVMAKALESNNLEDVVKALKIGWESKKATSTKVSSVDIDNLYEQALLSGAKAGKISGAGGGGFMLFFVPIEERGRLVAKLSEFQGITYNCHFSNEGAKAWTAL
jgi:D-glycero-alpha-D-manno-heptose-7-phosphate kinase